MIGSAMNVKVVGYFDRGRGYEDEADGLEKTLAGHDLDYEIYEVGPFSSWRKAVAYKPQFIRRALSELREYDGLLYIDVDARVVRKPDFEVLRNIHFGFHRFKRSRHHKPEALTGTLWLANTVKVREFLDKWIEMTPKFTSNTPEQDSLAYCLKAKRPKDFYVGNLPPTWCWIFDDFPPIYGNDKKPVIVHYQASRKQKKK